MTAKDYYLRTTAEIRQHAAQYRRVWILKIDPMDESQRFDGALDRLWDSARLLDLEPPPAMLPAAPWRLEAALQSLDRLIEWCDRQAGRSTREADAKPAPDPPDVSEPDEAAMAWTFLPDAAVYRGVRIPLTGKDYSLLLALVDAGNDSTGRPRAVDANALADAAWGHDEPVELENLRRRLSRIRSAIRRKLDLPSSFDPIVNANRGQYAAWRLNADLRQAKTEKTNQADSITAKCG